MKPFASPAVLMLVSLTGAYAMVGTTIPAAEPPRFGSPEAWRATFNAPQRARPQTVAPLDETALAADAIPPAEAIVLFDGRDLSRWKPTQWKIENNYVEIVPKSGNLETLEAFGSCRLHLEWWTTDTLPLKKGQDRGNSGVFFMGIYEVQILDTWENPTYADGMAGAVYGQYPPSVNPIRPPGRWQYYDITFHRPVFTQDGIPSKPARLSVVFNGVKVQDKVELLGPTNPPGRRPYRVHEDKRALVIQDHKEIVRFRNIWIVPIAD